LSDKLSVKSTPTSTDAALWLRAAMELA
jgi:hypothetical protein